MNNRILVIGAAVIDIIIEVEKLPRTGEDIYGNLTDSVVGGCGYNVQRILSKFDIPVDFLCPVGTGQYADFIRKDFQKKGIDLLVNDERMDNSWNISFVEKDGERTFLSIPGVEVHWLHKWFDVVDVNQYRYIYISGYEMEGESGEIILSELEKISGQETTKILFDPSPRAAFLNQELLHRLYQLKPIIHCNRDELLTLSNETKLDKAIESIFQKTQTELVVTLGAEGAVWYIDASMVIVPSDKVEVVDTIGAGDSHTAAFIAGKVLGLSGEKACFLANQVSAMIVSNESGSFEGLNAESIMQASV